MRVTVATILAVGAIATIAGCGDDAPITTVSTKSSPASEAPAEDTDFTTEADSRCAEANAAIANLTSDAASTGSVTQELAITEGLLSDLQALDPPSDPALDQFFTALEDEVAALEEQESAITSGDTATAETLGTEVDQARSNAAAAASEYGFQDCGQEGTTLPEDGTSTSTSSEPAVPAPATTTPVPVEPAPVTPTPVEPAPAPVTPPPTGGTGTGGSTGGTGSTGSTGSTGGVGPG